MLTVADCRLIYRLSVRDLRRTASPLSARIRDESALGLNRGNEPASMTVHVAVIPAKMH